MPETHNITPAALPTEAAIADTLDLAILSAEDKTTAIVLARYGTDIAIASLPFGSDLQELLDFSNRINQVILLNQPSPTKAEVKSFGQKLFRYIIRGEVEQLYNLLPPDPMMRIHILTNRPDLQSLPWEYLQARNQGIGPMRNRSIVRIIPTIGLRPLKPLNLANEKLKILFVYAVPQDQSLVSWPTVQSKIQDAIARSAGISTDKYQLKMIQGTTKGLFAAFQDKNEKYDIFQFSGHGDVDPQTGEGRLYFVDSQRSDQSHPVSASDLSILLRDRGIRLAVLSACRTSAGNSGDPFNIVAEALLRSGIPAVVANQLPVPDTSVPYFVGPLYAQLINTGDIDVAVYEGRANLAIELGGSPFAALEWGIPTLYRYIDGQKVFQL